VMETSQKCTRGRYRSMILAIGWNESIGKSDWHVEDLPT